MIGGHKIRSACWSAILIPFLFLPYRYLWLLSALAASFFFLPNRLAWREKLRRDGTLIVGTAILLLVREALDPAWWAPWFAFVALVWWWRGRRNLGRPIQTIVALSIWIAAFVLLARPDLDWSTSTKTIPTDTVIVCAGDSLTSGVDIRSDDYTYVAELRQRLPFRVINAGIANDKTRDLRKRLQKDVLSRKPSVVVVFIGGNDFLDGTPRGEFSEELDKVVGQITATGAKVVLVEVPTGIVWDPYSGIYRRIALRHNALLVPESMLRLWFSIELIARDSLIEPVTIDGIHLSPSGAQRVADWLEPHIRNSLKSS